MDWISSHLGPLGLLAVAAMTGSYWCPRRSVLRRLLLAIGVGSLVAVAGGLLYVVNASPGREITVDDEKPPERSPVPADRFEPLRAAWKAGGSADWPVAETLAVMSDIAYQPPVNAKESFAKLGCDRVETFVDGSMVGYVVSCRDVAVVVFRGSDDYFDWFANLNDFCMTTPHGEIHKGFYDAYQPLKPQIVTILGQYNPKHLWITGHSLGGALALVCAYDVIDNEKIVVQGVITFGQPMVAQKNLATYLDKLLEGRYAHFVNGDDIVARVPPSFVHCGSLVWFTGGGIKRSKAKDTPDGVTKATKFATMFDDILPPTSDDILPLSKDEFERAKADLRGKRSDNLQPANMTKGFNITVPSPFEDHSMRFYLDKVRSIFKTTGSK